MRVGFPVLQPVVEMDAERVLAVGRGVACIEAGRVVWSRATDLDAYATAFGDGSVALGLGRHVVLLDRNGNTMQSMELPTGAAVVAPPAVAADGTLLILTATQLYRVSVVDV